MKEAYINGKVFTGTGFVSAFTVEDGYFTETGNDKEILSSLKADGMLADFTVLDGDPFTSDPEEIDSIKASMVYLGGKKVYGRVI